MKYILFYFLSIYTLLSNYYEITYDVRYLPLEEKGVFNSVCSYNGKIKAFTYVKGAQTEVLKSIDNGYSWETEYIDINYNGLITSAIYKNDLTVIGTMKGRIIINQNNDSNYRLINSAYPGIENTPIQTVGLIGKNILINQKDYLFYSKDFGNNWDTLFQKDSTTIKGIYSNDDGLISIPTYKYDSTKQYSIYTSLDTGKTWAKFDVDFTVINIEIIDSVGYACGWKKMGIGDLRYDIIYKTVDYGITWKEIYNQANKTEFGLSCLRFKNRKNGIVVGSASKVLITKDSGNTWLQIPWEFDKPCVLTACINNNGDYILATDYPGILVLSSEAGINEYNEKDELRLSYVNGSLIYRFNDDEVIPELYSIRVYDILGNSVYSGIEQIYPNTENHINISNSSSGIYFLTLESRTKEFRKKFVIN